MRIFRGSEHVPAEVRGAAVVVGNFDGVHRGHQAVIGEGRRIAEVSGLKLALITFEPHPRAYFQPGIAPFRLTPLRIKAHCLEALGVDFLFVLHFNRQLAELEAADFVRKVLVRDLAAAHVVVGEDFVFGRNRGGDAALLARMGKTHGFAVDCVAKLRAPDGEVYSSSRIRAHLVAGAPARAAELLGRSWEIEGRVVRGDGQGRVLGFPTANVDMGEYLRPAHGIYAVRAGIDEGAATRWHEAVASFGRRPTQFGADELFEVHLFDFAGDLYGRHLRVAMIGFLRPEKKFDGIDALKAQIAEDCRASRTILAATRESFRAAERPLAAAFL